MNSLVGVGEGKRMWKPMLPRAWMHEMIHWQIVRSSDEARAETTIY